MLNKSVVVGVSITPEIGLEVAQIDFASQTILKYGVRKLEYNSARQEIADMDIFKDALQDLFLELGVSSGTNVVLNLPTALFNVQDYPAALDDVQISNALEESLAEHPIFREVETSISAVKVPSASMQFNKIAYTVVQKQMLIEVALIIKNLGCKLYAIDTSINSILNALMYKQRIDVSNDMNWLLLVVDNNYCRVLSMNGKDYVDCAEEKISIGEVLSDAENYATVVTTVSPILKNIPSKYLCVVSNTNIISAEVLASKLTYSAPIIYQEANCFAKEAFLDSASSIDAKTAVKGGQEVKVYTKAHAEGYGSVWSDSYDYTNYRTGVQIGEDSDVAIGTEGVGGKLTGNTLSDLVLTSTSKNFNPVVVNKADATLDNPVIVGAADHHHFAQAQRGLHGRGRALMLSRIPAGGERQGDGE